MKPRTPPPLWRATKWIVLLVLLAAAYSLSWRVTQPDFLKLIVAAPKAKQIIGDFLHPDIIEREAEISLIEIPFPIPCGSTEVEAAPAPVRLRVEPACAEPRGIFRVSGSDLGPGSTVVMRWLLPSGGTLPIEQYPVDEEGAFSAEIQARPIAATKDGVPARLQAEVSVPLTRIHVSQAMRDVLNAIMVTIFMALLSTTLGTLIAAPLSFLAARNITRTSRLGSVVYYLVRSLLNITRSFEPLVIATIFALIVGYGTPFAGVLGLVITTAASLGKMFSEAVESIDPGPIEAITASGARRSQVVMYGVVPQIIPDFLSYIIYHWDINVRLSTIIGFVGGGGIGYYLSQRFNSFEYHKASTAILAIIVVVWALDFLSAQVRKRMA
ncbi:MAG: phosphonate ABC transporter, permease protein PhnE [Chloroflexi bacterium RBG_16_64_43]|nr:MAG: phosphonate ABC transporter, permease protein PhnE [Chloroflexi bacterium RBG_16_64_43]